MATGFHGSVRTMARVQAELQASQGSARALAARYGLNVKTVDKLRSRSTTADKNLWDLPSRVAPSSRMLKKRWRLSQAPYLASPGRPAGASAQNPPPADTQCLASLLGTPWHQHTAQQ